MTNELNTKSLSVVGGYLLALLAPRGCSPRLPTELDEAMTCAFVDADAACRRDVFFRVTTAQFIRP